VEDFARKHEILAAALIVLGGADQGSKLVVGPEQGRSSPVVPMERVLGNAGEIAGVGTIFPDAHGQPNLHMHIACGRDRHRLRAARRADVACDGNRTLGTPRHLQPAAAGRSHRV